MTFIDALEQYSAEHPESVDELLTWPASRFEAFYESFSKRKITEQLEDRKNAMIAGLHGNSNFSGEALGKAVQSIEDSFSEAVAALYRPADAEDEAEKALKENPFFTSMKVPEINKATYTESGFPYEIERDGA